MVAYRRRQMVVTIIAVGVFAVFLYQYRQEQMYKRREAQVTKEYMSVILVAMEAFKMDNGRYPAGSMKNIMAILCGDNKHNRVYIHDRALLEEGEYRDYWGEKMHLIILSKDGKEYVKIISNGPNRLEEGGKEDDIVVTNESK
jgi:type II secretory pathway pseudopilin PulG